MQLAQAQALGARLITRVFKATSMQTLYVKAYLTLIGFELDKKVDQTTTRLCSGPLYQTLIPNQSTHPRQSFAPLKTLEERYTKLFGNNIHKLESKPAYILALLLQIPTINIPNSKEKPTQLHNEHLASKSP